jgi:hypothetical protein
MNTDNSRGRERIAPDILKYETNFIRKEIANRLPSTMTVTTNYMPGNKSGTESAYAVIKVVNREDYNFDDYDLEKAADNAWAGMESAGNVFDDDRKPLEQEGSRFKFQLNSEFVEELEADQNFQNWVIVRDANKARNAAKKGRSADAGAPRLAVSLKPVSATTPARDPFAAAPVAAPVRSLPPRQTY